jgi:hypothetical protein
VSENGLKDRVRLPEWLRINLPTTDTFASYQWAVDAALAGGASEADIVDVLTAVAPILGLARVASAAPELALALGYDVDEPGDD